LVLFSKKNLLPSKRPRAFSKAGKSFFFEKEKQKTFASIEAHLRRARTNTITTNQPATRAGAARPPRSRPNKSKQKKGGILPPPKTNKSFLLLFYKKEVLSSY